MSFRRFIALLCLIAGSFGSGTVAALDCTITMGRSCQGVDSVFNIDAQFPLDTRSYFVIANRGAEECRLFSGGGPWQGAMNIPGGGAIDFYGLGKDKLIVSEGRKCDLSIRVEQMSRPSPISPSPPSTFDVVCPPAGHYLNGQPVEGGWRISIQSGRAAYVSRWEIVNSSSGPEPETTVISCLSSGQNLVIATKVIPGKFSCVGQGHCQRQ